MAKIARITALPFASTASGGQIGTFGSKSAGAPATTTDPAVAQSLSQWLSGWYAAVIDGNSPCIEDMNSFCFVVMYLLTYAQQAGIQEWDAGTTYYIGSLVNVSGTIYSSLTDGNLNHAVTDPANWGLQGKKIRNVTGTDTATVADQYIRGNPTAGSYVQTLPPVATCATGFTLTVKNIATNGNTVTVKGNASENIDDANTFVLASGTTKEAITVLNNGTSWDII